MTEAQALAIARQTRLPLGGRSGLRARLGWSVATLVVAALLIGLTWANTLRALRTERRVAIDHALSRLTGEATLAAAAFRHRLIEAEGLLTLLALDADRAGPGFDLRAAVAAAAPLLPPAGGRVALIGASGRVRQASDPALVGRKLTPLPRSVRLRHRLGAGRQLVLDVPLRALMAPLVVANLPAGSVLALIDTSNGRVRFRIPAAAGDLPRPGAWVLGTSSAGLFRPAPGLAPVLLARAAIPGHPLAIAILRDQRPALAPITTAAWGNRRLAIAISALIFLAALVVLGEIEAMLRRERRMTRDRATLAEANAALARAKTQADAKTAQLEGLLAGLPVGVIMMDAGLRMVACNPQVAALAGLPPPLLRPGTTIEAMLRAQAEAGEFGPEAGEGEIARRIALYHAGRAYGRFERRRPDGRWVEIRRERLPDGGFVALFTDISDRRRADQALAEARAAAEAANDAKSRFVAMVSHEIRTPLQALLTGLDLLADTGPADAPVRAGMREAGTSLRRLLADILDVSRFEAGRLILSPVGVDPRVPLGQALAMLAPGATERGIRLVFTPDPALPARIEADPERLCQVVGNLLSNAVKFADPGVVRLTTAGAGDRLRIVVTDPGPTIPPERRAQLFQPFAGTGEPGAEGTGLGLAICRELVTAMGGEIGHDVAPGGAGNVFWFTLPLAPVAAPGLPQDAGLRILLAEDVAASRLVTATMLRREGCAVTEAGDGATAARAAAAEQFDVVLMDLDLPVLDGMAATRRIRALPGPAGTVPVIALSGHIGAEEQAAALAAGVDEILAKPAARAVLLAALARHAGRTKPGAVLSEARLRELRETLTPAALARAAEDCLAELAARLAGLRAALAAGDAAAAAAALHAMAGLAGGYGLAEFERAARAAMAALRAGGVTDPERLEAALERAGREIRAWAAG